jgi:hypothetical protein
MGSLLYDQEATQEKQDKMIRKANTTTSGSLGLKISGFKVGLNKLFQTGSLTHTHFIIGI